jgi:hypothetical protein
MKQTNKEISKRHTKQKETERSTKARSVRKKTERNMKTSRHFNE